MPINETDIDKSSGKTQVRCRNPESIEFRTLADANRVRREFTDIVILRDDARKKTVSICGDAPTSVRETIGRIAYHSFEQNNDNFGQTPLSRLERREIDFTRTNVFHARACKAISVEFVVDDWLALYDHTLTVSEHIDIYRRAGRPSARADGPTMRELAGGGQA